MLSTLFGNMKDLTNAAIDRQNVLNNLETITSIQEYLGVRGMLYEVNIALQKKK